MGRPDSPEFWRMVEVIQDLDSAADDGMNAERITGGTIDLQALAYMAEQRALRAKMHGMTGDVALQAMWFEAFIAGVMYQRRAK